MLEKIGLPAKPSLRGNNWVDDASHCQGCSSQFTFINRKVLILIPWFFLRDSYLFFSLNLYPYLKICYFYFPNMWVGSNFTWISLIWNDCIGIWDSLSVNLLMLYVKRCEGLGDPCPILRWLSQVYRSPPPLSGLGTGSASTDGVLLMLCYR